MVKYGKKIRALRDKKNILTLVLSEKKFLNGTKNHNPPFKLNGRSLSREKCLIQPYMSDYKLQEYFFQQHWESEYFFLKKTITPPPSS
jgi:hypothetical protein